MKLYQHPVSTTCRPVIMFIADESIPVEQQIVDIMSGEQHAEPYAQKNPSGTVPMLEDGDFRLIESAAILKYLANKCGSPAYPQDPQARATVDAMMDWVNTNLYRSFGYAFVYPQIMDHFKLPDPSANAQAVALGKTHAQRYLGVLNDHFLGGDKPWLCGDRLTLADYLLSGILSIGETIGCTFADYPNIRAWYERIKARPNWQSCNGGVYQWADMLRGQQFNSL